MIITNNCKIPRGNAFSIYYYVKHLMLSSKRSISYLFYYFCLAMPQKRFVDNCSDCDGKIMARRVTIGGDFPSFTTLALILFDLPFVTFITFSIVIYYLRLYYAIPFPHPMAEAQC